MTEQQVAAPPSPYKGLAAFEDSSVDALFFFGREREREIVAANLLAYRLTVLYGASGVGKSSLLQAGVAHGLRRQGEAVVVFRSWSGDPVTSLVDEVRETLRASFPDAVVDDSEDGLAASLAAWATALDRDLYLILDQLDEYFLYHEDDDGFAADLAEVATRPGLRANVLLSIRDDMLSQLDRFKALIPNLLSNYLRLDHLDRRSAREAIVGPLDRYNALVPPDERVTAEPELVEAVLDGSGSDGRIEAPYLQLVMQRLWEEEHRRGSRTLTLDTLERLGGAGEIVRAHLDDALESLSPRDRDLAAKLFNHLVTPSGTKIAHGIGDLAKYAAVNEGEVAPVLAALVDERIVRPVTPRGQPDGGQYEIFHDVLAEPVVAWRARHEAERELATEREAAKRRHRRMLAVLVASLVALAAMAAVTIDALTDRHEAVAKAHQAEEATNNFKKKAADFAVLLKHSQIQRKALKKETKIATQQKNAANEQKKIATQQKNAANEQKKIATQQKNAANEQKKIATQQKNAANEQKKIATQQKNAANEQKKIATQQKNAANEQKKIATQQKNAAVEQKNISPGASVTARKLAN